MQTAARIIGGVQAKLPLCLDNLEVRANARKQLGAGYYDLVFSNLFSKRINLSVFYLTFKSISDH
jgi:hypothetical protein